MAVSIIFESVDFTFQPNTPFEVHVLHDINLSIPTNQVTAIIGHTGSGKSTLIQHLNVLLRPTKGKVTIDGETITSKSDNKSLKPLRKKVGVVFQFPEAQLFEETVLKDVMFGPLNFGLTEEEAKRVAMDKLELVGINEELYDRSPFDLSGGQMRRVAIAGVLALEPEVLVLDEPTAGLDPLGQIQMLEMFMALQKKNQLSLVLVTHQMDDVALYAHNVIVMEKGRIVNQGTPEEIFADPNWLREKQLGLPKTLDFIEDLEKELSIDLKAHLPQTPLTVDQLADALLQIFNNLQGRGAELNE